MVTLSIRYQHYMRNHVARYRNRGCVCARYLINARKLILSCRSETAVSRQQSVARSEKPHIKRCSSLSDGMWNNIFRSVVAGVVTGPLEAPSVACRDATGIKKKSRWTREPKQGRSSFRLGPHNATPPKQECGHGGRAMVPTMELPIDNTRMLLGLKGACELKARFPQLRMRTSGTINRYPLVNSRRTAQ